MINDHPTITVKQAGQRLDVYLHTETKLSRAFLQRQIKAQQILVNARASKASQILEIGDQIYVPEPKTDSQPKRTAPNLTVIYEDSDLLVIDKPAGVLTHPVRPNSVEPTVADFARSKMSDALDSDDRPGIVHRLDRDTSGLLILAKNEAAKTKLQSQFKRHLVAKTYLILVQGRPKNDQATIDLALARSHGDGLKRKVASNGKTAVTKYKLLAAYPGYSLLEASPQTGRTHQLRVHFAHIGHPVAGDIVYGPNKRPMGLKRHFLHATKLQFSDRDGNRLSIVSPLPTDLQTFLEQLDPE